ncbi:MAG: phosphoethanolamine--lipid A transferase [Methylibium sp.]|nr:phosphoethanolamine--lipid A transferase [Methylibium sp.]
MTIPALRPFGCGFGFRSWRSFRIAATVEQVLLAASVYWVASANGSFFGAALAERALPEPATWGYAAALAAMLVAGHVFLLAMFANRWLVKPMLAVLVVSTAFASYFMQHYGTYMDPSMLRNVLHTDANEARELFSGALVVHLLVYAAVPLALLSRVRIVDRGWPKAVLVRLGVLLLAGTVAVVAILTVFQPFSSFMRNHKEARYLITPANYLWSLARVATRDAQGMHAAREPIGLDARPGPSWSAHKRPTVVVLVVGETARAANWGLNGYARQTTPQLSRLPVVNFRDVSACGTSTEVSLPCMFAPVGRRDYDESRIQGSESLLHVAARAGVSVRWRDNQSGCKGVCDGLPTEAVSSIKGAGPCSDGRCMDEALLYGLDERLTRAQGVQLLVLHQLGNHGPAYHRRYPEAFARFQPACEDDDLQNCTREQIVNAYDNALLYTDHVLARLIATMNAHADQVDTAVVYVSDHGESLGEGNLFLHGMPYAIAPAVQTRVPMLTWMSAGFQNRNGFDTACLQRRAQQPASHDHLFHTVLGMLDVQTALYEPAWDALRTCRGSSVATAAR